MLAGERDERVFAGQRQTLFDDGRASRIANELLQSLGCAGRNAHGSMQREAVEMGAHRSTPELTRLLRALASRGTYAPALGPSALRPCTALHGGGTESLVGGGVECVDL